MPDMQTDAVRDVLAERCRQIEVERRTLEKDDQNDKAEMATAAACYALSAAGWRKEAVSEIWPKSWLSTWWKPTNRRRDLVKAGALILAEIERIDRAALIAQSERPTP